MLMPGERADIWVDFTTLARKQVILRSLSFDPGGMMGGVAEVAWVGGRHGWRWRRVWAAFPWAPSSTS